MRSPTRLAKRHPFAWDNLRFQRRRAPTTPRNGRKRHTNNKLLNTTSFNSLPFKGEDTSPPTSYSPEIQAIFFPDFKSSEFGNFHSSRGFRRTIAVSPVTKRNTMAEQRKAVIKNADMSEEMQQDAVDIASQALSKYNIEKVSEISLSLLFEPVICRLLFLRGFCTIYRMSHEGTDCIRFPSPCR